MQVQSVTNATTIVLTTTLSFNHKRYEDVTKLFGNEINIYRAANVNGEQPADGSFSILTTVAIEVDALQTTYLDSTGSSSYWYKYTYYNSTSTGESAIADSTAQRGGGYGHYCSIYDVRREAGLLNNQNISDALIDSRRIDAERECDAEVFQVYSLPFATPVPAPIAQAARLIAAGLLLAAEYGPMGKGGLGIGQEKLQQGRTLLMRIKDRELILTDPAGNTLLEAPRVASWPDDTTDQTGSNLSQAQLASLNADLGPKFRSSDIY